MPDLRWPDDVDVQSFVRPVGTRPADLGSVGVNYSLATAGVLISCHRNWALPLYIHRGAPVELEDGGQTGGSSLRGMPTIRGTVTATARIVRSLDELHRVKPGEILVWNSTDPGWTSALLLIKGIVVETGGMLSHASNLSREYGFPAVQLPDAIRLIPDGATITINGDTGSIVIEETKTETGDGFSRDRSLEPAAAGRG